MSFVSNFFKGEKSNTTDTNRNQILQLSELLSEVKTCNNYLSSKQIKNSLSNYKELIDNLAIINSSNLLSDYCKKNNMSLKTVKSVIDDYKNIDNIIDECNEKYIQQKLIEEKNYLDNILYDVDPAIKLDDNQRKIVISDDDYSLIVAGAGAGKTTTISAKVKYLVDKKHVDPSTILVISFTNKAVDELKERINRRLKIDCPIATFHSTGNAIIHKQTDEKMQIVDNSKLYFILQDYFKSSILTDEKLVNNLVLFFSSYFDTNGREEDLASLLNKLSKSNFSTLKSDFNEFKQDIIDSKTRKSITIQNEVLRSQQEVEIANFLYMNNIDYKYEPIYPYNILYAKKPYTPDFIITQQNNIAYIEHFGIDQNGKNSLYTSKQLQQYKKAISDKIKLHKEHGTKLIYTFSNYNDNKELLVHLKEQLISNGFQLNPRSNQEVMNKLMSDQENRYTKKIISLLCRFISNFKVNGYESEEFDRMYHSTTNVRSKLFLNICQQCYLHYQNYLKQNNAVDFEDLINQSAKILNEVKEMKTKLDFNYIIVDEYQDISKQRFNLVKALFEVTDSKFIAVGDDFQSIYAFSGSDISLFTKFKETLGDGKLYKIVNTYRNSQEIIDIAGNFVQKNKQQIPKELISPKRIDNPVIIYTYDNSKKYQKGDYRSGVNYSVSRCVEEALDHIVENRKNQGKELNSSVLVLGRYGFDGYQLERTGLFEYDSKTSKITSNKYPFLKIRFLTVHTSKGLGFDDVILINCRNETYGFPSKIEDDPILSFVIKADRSIDYAEERRLFYVSMTRTKNRVYMVAPQNNPSEFLIEIMNDYKDNVTVIGPINSQLNKSQNRNTCPVCGYPLQYRYKNSYGLKLYLCTNEPELCSFMSNDLSAGDVSIQKCDKCKDGYLIIKPGKNLLLGCTNYKKDNTGCNNIIPLAVNLKDKEQWQTFSQSSTTKRVFVSKADFNPVMYNEMDLNDIIHIILQALNDISEKHFYIKEVLCDVLLGSHSKSVLTYKLTSQPLFARLSDFDAEELSFIIQWLVDKKLISLANHKNYQALKPNYAGNSYQQYLSEKDLLNLKEALTDLSKPN
ncbi:MAG: UvrD-helicase domain-containing protein [Erysipelotrichaceae bacterium]